MTRQYEKLLTIVKKELAKIQSSTEREVIRNYSSALDAIRKELLRLYDRYAVNGVLTRAEMTRYNRLTNMEKSIQEIMLPVVKNNVDLIHRLQGEAYEQAFFRNAWALDQTTGVSMTWGVVRPEVVTASIESNLAALAIKKMKQDALIRVNRAVTQGIIRGSSYDQMAKVIKDQLINPSMTDAFRIARTEGNRAMQVGAQESYAKAEELGVEMDEIWDATLDARTRPEHGALDGKAKDKEHNGWHVPGIGWVPGPLQSGVASFDINCRCSVRPQVKGYAPKVRRIRDEGLVPYKTYEQWKDSLNSRGKAAS